MPFDYTWILKLSIFALPELYRVGKGEQSVFSGTLQTEILPYWRSKLRILLAV